MTHGNFHQFALDSTGRGTARPGTWASTLKQLAPLPFLLVLGTAACGDEPQAQLPMNPALRTQSALSAPYRQVRSHSGLLVIEARTLPRQPPVRGTISVDLTITDGTGAPVDGLILTVEPWMPSMGHGTYALPKVTPKGGGHYDVSEVHLFMPGQWELRTTIDGAVKDGASLLLDVL